MKKQLIFALAGLAAAGSICLSACSQESAAFPDVIQVKNVDALEGKTITVNSRDTVRVTPDKAEIVFGIVTENQKADACQQENTQKLDQLLQFLKEQGFSDSSIRTSDYYLDTQYDWSGDRREIVGYEMRTQVTVTDVEIDEVGALLSRGVGAGANEVNSVSYFSSSYDQAYADALAGALELARTKGEALAAASGKSLGGVQNIQEYADQQNGRYISSGTNFRKEAAGAALTEDAVADMGVMPGQMQVSAEICVEFELTE